jgi:anti-anti-sigma factor
MTTSHSGSHPGEFALAISRENAVLTVRVSGELDYDTSDDLTEEVAAHLTAAQPPIHDVRMDFTGLTWIDSSGLSALLSVHRRARALGATLHLDNRPGVLERMLRLTDVLGYLTAAPTVSSAGVPRPAAREDDGLTGAGAT